MGRFIILLLSGLFFVSCAERQKNVEESGMGYAKGLSVTEYRDYTRVVVSDPWNKGGILDTYILVRRDSAIPDSLPEGTVIRVPLERMVVYSDVHARVMAELGVVSAVKGVCDARYFKTAAIVSGLASGGVADCGSSLSPTVEQVVSAKPDAIMLSPYQNAGYGALENLGVPIVKMADYMESTPLGRAEWIKLMGLLFDRKAKADSIFSEVEKSYLNLKKMAAGVPERPKVISETMAGGVWYVPGGGSYKAAMFADAGGDYPWAGNVSQGSLALDFAQVLEKAQDADLWLVTTYGRRLTAKDFLDIYEHNDKFAAYVNHGVYYVDSSQAGIFEETPFHPDLLLKEYVKLFHPELLPGYQLKYYRQMEY